MMDILKNQRGQGVWEYMVILIGIAIVAVAVSAGLKTGMVGDGSGGVTATMTNKLDSLANTITTE